MRASHICSIRRRKIQLYERLLPAFRELDRELNLDDDRVYVDLLRRLVMLAPPGFGCLVGQQRRLSDLGILGHVTLGCATLREVLDVWMIFSDSAGEPVTFSSELDAIDAAGLWRFSIQPDEAVPPAVADLLVDELTASFFVFGVEMTGRQFEGFTTDLTHSKLAEVDYATVLPGVVRFDQPITRITGPANALQVPIHSDEEDALAAVWRRLDAECDDLVGDKPVARAVYAVMMRSSAQRLTLGGAAASLALSERTLVRKLASEGTRFGEVLEDFRHRYALALLEQGGLQAKQIAHMVGFGSENGLRKAFLGWTGRPIGSWSIGETERDSHVLQLADRSSSKRAY